MSVPVRALAFFACCIASMLVQAAEDPEARAWLERMSSALSTRNYEGRFIHLNDARSETMRILHRFHDGKITERLVSLDGSGREIVRTDSEVICYLPDKKKVLVTKRSENSSLLAALPAYSSEVASLYDIKLGAAGKVLGRPTQLITVEPRDEFRYGYRLWLDAESAMPLKSQLCDRSGRVVEQMAFAQLDMRDDIDADSLTATVNTDGFQWLKEEYRRGTVPIDSSPNTIGWAVVRPPPGFRLTITRVQAMAGSQGLVRHLVYSDGLASVSVFIEPKNEQGTMHGLARVGSAFAFSVDMKGHQVTAVGEVPAVTVESIATSVIPAKENK